MGIELDYEDEVKRLLSYLEEFKQISPPLGSMKGVSHTIKIEKKFSITFKTYSVPLKLREKVEKELDNMLKLNII